MKYNLLKVAVLAGALTWSVQVMAQSQQTGFSNAVELSDNGSFSMDLRQQKITEQQLENSLPKMLGLNNSNKLKEINRDTDNLGFLHITYQQFFKDIPVDNAMVLMHLKDGRVTSANGLVLKIPDNFALPLYPISVEKAIGYAKTALGVAKLIRQYPAELVITKNSTELNQPYALAWKVRVDGKNKDGLIKMTRVFVDAGTGNIINHYPLMFDADVTASAKTYYRGQKTITTDSIQGHYLLRDSVRKVYTFNAGGVSPDSSQIATSPFEEDVDYLNSDTSWEEVLTLNSMSVDSLSSSSSFLHLGQTGVLASAIGHGTYTTDLDSGDFLSTNILFPAPTSLPIQQDGLLIQVTDDSLYGMLAAIVLQSFQPITYEVTDSLFFQMSDTSLGVHNWSDTNGNAGTYTMEMDKNPALDAHWGMEQTHDFYLDVFNRDSYDGSGSKIKNYVNGMVAYGGTQNNAAALPEPYNAMVYGLGDGVIMGPVVGLDVMGHEFSHLVTGHNGRGGLNYQGEAGALNESFSDMMGTSIEFFSDSSNANWTIGEQVMLQTPFYMRSMSNPNGPSIVSDNFQRQPDTYYGQYWYTGQQDNGGVHINSGVPNKWFYLVAEGGSGTNDNDYHYQVTGQGLSKAEKIAYRTFQHYLTPSATFTDAYHNSLTATEDLFGANSPEYTTVVEAWKAVGIPIPTGINNTTIEGQNDNIKVYPNPASQQMTVVSAWQQPFEAVIYNVVGVKIRSIKVNPGKNSVNIADLARGTYFLKFVMNNRTYSKKLTAL